MSGLRTRRRRSRAAVAALVLWSLLAVPALAGAAVAPAPQHWLVVSDLHVDLHGSTRRVSRLGQDTDPALLASLLRELRRVAPNPPVVFIAGDFIAHEAVPQQAAATMTTLAQRFNATFPHAQFVIALGNNDSDCGDYEAPLDGPFLKAVARAWEPLVNRHGAAPQFAQTFAHDGGYSATLPLPRLRAVVVNDVYGSVRYRNACGSGASPDVTSLDDLAGRLYARGRDRVWLVAHVPPGIDAFSTTHLTHHLLVVPFLRPHARDRLLDLIDDPRGGVALVIAGHTHKFSFRLSAAGDGREVPMLLAPSVSPIFDNAPSFLTLAVTASGTVTDVSELSYHHGAWTDVGDTRSLGAATFTGPDLARTHAALATSPALRARFARLYSGAGAPLEIFDWDWRAYWCAMTALRPSAFDACSTHGGFSVLTPRALVLGALGLLALAAVALALLARRRGVRRRFKPATDI